METTRELEQTLRALSTLIKGPAAKQWRKRVEKYADQLATGNTSGTPEFLAMYQGTMGSFLDLQAPTKEAHEEFIALRNHAYNLAKLVSRKSGGNGT